MEHLQLVVDERGVATVTIDHPPVNLMSVDVLIELLRTGEQLSADEDVRVVVLQSANPEWFIAHFDVEAILSLPVGRPPAGELNGFDRMCETYRTMPKPTIAVIEGRVGGGGDELALACDMRFASPQAVFNQPEVALGIIPGGGGTVRLPRLIGRSRAMEAVLGCDDVDADTAARWGWVNRVLPPGELHRFVDRLAGRIASFPADAVAAAKASVLRAEVHVVDDLLEESAAFDATLSDPQTRRRSQAFLALGGQTPDGERRLGELAAELPAP